MATSPVRAGTLNLRWFFLFFAVSGFCSLLYEIVWLRLAMASFGVTSALLSLVLSAFMAGMGIGSWAAGRLTQLRETALAPHALRVYAITESLIGVSALAVPAELVWARHLLAHFSLAASGTYYLLSGICIALILVPWCACMGATIPFAMLAIRVGVPQESERSFSYLYLANVLGAVLGAFVPPLLVELCGFHGTLLIAALLNLSLATGAATLAHKSRVISRDSQRFSQISGTSFSRSPLLLTLLFATGCTSLGIEVVWVRLFTPYVGTVVYAFATILGTYLLFTYLGSRVYRARSRQTLQINSWVWGLLGFTAVFASFVASPQYAVWKAMAPIFGIAPFSAVLGFVTPMLVDRWSHGDPQKAGTAYAVNVVGCIVGPLISGFLLLPFLSERRVLLLFALPWLALAFIPASGIQEPSTKTLATGYRLSFAMLVLSITVFVASRDFGRQLAHSIVLRDNTATVVAAGEGMHRRLLVNGFGITELTPTTKFMAHLPLSSLEHEPRNALVICFGMGTTFRSLLTWGIPTTAVELVPSVPKLFGFFHEDAGQLMSSPLAHVVIDDGRAYLERTSEQFDVITIDPPPPVGAAGSSLLYSKEFYGIIRSHLSTGGILQQWLPYGDRMTVSAVARALVESFPEVRVFGAVSGPGLHFLAGSQPIPVRSATELAARMPEAAQRDFVEWGPSTTAIENLNIVLQHEFPVSQAIERDPRAPALQDDHPVNEYYLLRRKILHTSK